MNIILLLISQESEYLAWANAVIDKQHDLAATSITVIIALAVILLGGTWYTNFFLSRREMKDIVNSLKAEIEEKYSESLVRIDSSVNAEICKVRKENEDIIEKRMLLFDADKARLFAIASMQLKVWCKAACWWATCVPYYEKLKQDNLLRTAVDAINDNLKRCKVINDEDKDDIKKCLPCIPSILESEKKEIEKNLERLTKKTTDE